MNNMNSNTYEDEDLYTSIAVRWPEPISEAGYYGIAGQFVRMVENHTEADPNAILMAFLVYAGCLLGRIYFVPTGADKHCGNIYVCLVGPTAGGRKGSAIAAAEQFFTSGENAPYSLGETNPRIIHGISSGEGVIWQVHDAIKKRTFSKKNQTFEDILIEEDVTDKRAVYNLSEFQQSISNMRRPDSILSSILRQAWDKDRIESPSKNTAAKSTGAHISMIAAITKEELLIETENLPMAQNGTLNRFMFPCCKRVRLLPQGDTFHKLIDTPEWKELQKQLTKNIKNALGATLMIERTDEAQEDWGVNDPIKIEDGCLYKTLSQPRPGLWGAITARAAQQVIRMSLITAIINGEKTITREVQDASSEYWRYSDDSCKYIWGDTTDPTAGYILHGLREASDGLSRSEINELFFGHRTKEQIADALKWLSHRGLAYSKKRHTGGRPEEKWFATI
jgi:hypothetical protein